MLQNIAQTLLSYKLEMPVGKAAIIALLGIAIVFAVLAVLVGILTLFKLVFGKVEAREQKKSATKSAAVEVDSSPSDDEDEITAVIMAAIACMEETEEVKAPFRVKSIREIK